MQPSWTTPSLAVRDLFMAPGTQAKLEAKRAELSRKLKRVLRSPKPPRTDRDSTAYRCIVAYARSIFVGVLLHFQGLAEGPGTSFEEPYGDLLKEIARWTKQEAVAFWHDLTGRPMPPDFDESLADELKRYVEGHAPESVEFSLGALRIRGDQGESVSMTFAPDSEGKLALVETVVDREGDRSPADDSASPRGVRLAVPKMREQLALLGLTLNGLVGVRGLSKPAWKTWLRSMHGKPIRRASAEAIVTRINAHRAGKKMPPIGLADLQ